MVPHQVSIVDIFLVSMIVRNEIDVSFYPNV